MPKCNHEFERRNYRNGGGICKHCGVFDMVFEPLERCVICNAVTYWTHGIDAEGKQHWFCQEHAQLRDKATLPNPHDEGLTFEQSMELLNRSFAYEKENR